MLEIQLKSTRRLFKLDSRHRDELNLERMDGLGCFSWNTAACSHITFTNLTGFQSAKAATSWGPIRDTEPDPR